MLRLKKAGVQGGISWQKRVWWFIHYICILMRWSFRVGPVCNAAFKWFVIVASSYR